MFKKRKDEKYIGKGYTSHDNRIDIKVGHIGINMPTAY